MAVVFIFFSCPRSRPSQELEEDLAWGNYDLAPQAESPRDRRKEEYEAQLTSEMLQYRGLTRLEDDGHPFAWWDAHLSTLPLLRDLALRVLCVPASSASSEHLFSKAGLTLTKKRASLKGSRVAQLV
ncbi:unnamed protein product, partial [Laminaria digitata]